MKQFIFLISIGFLFLGAGHPFHVSRCEIGFDEENTSMQITLHLFIDDLELALEEEYPKRLRIATRRESKAADSLITDYLRRHLVLTDNNQVIDYQMIGKEPTKDWAGIYCYLEAPLDAVPKELKIRNSIFLDVFDDQQNLLSIQTNQNKKWDTMFFNGHEVEAINLKDD